jgi:Fe(3+) dicitrate transport protein
MWAKSILFWQLLSFIFPLLASAQQTNDSSHIKYLPDVTIVGKNSKSDYAQMPEIVGTNIYAGKKNSLIILNNVQGNVSTNNMRQVLSKVPGIHIWESDGSGIQIGIASRGLSPNRSWEFNVRQNGYDIAADPFGYPEAYYNPQLQAVQRIEIVRGQGALQYGPQFGGLVNYILRNGNEFNKPLAFETQQTIGSFGLFNSYQAIGGKKGNTHYYSFFDHRSANGWRDNNNYYTNSGFATITHQFKNNLVVTFELMHSHIRSKQPGGLTDQQIATNAQQSERGRNWFDITWTTTAIIVNYELNKQTRWNTKLFGTIGNRNSVGFMQSIQVKDAINQSTNSYANRVVNLDQYRNYGIESRFITAYQLGKQEQNISFGVRAYTGNTHRDAEGKGNKGSDYDVTVEAAFPNSILFTSKNVAAFAENIFRLNNKFILIPGIRMEYLEGAAAGRIGFDTNGSPIELQNIKRSRRFVMAGIGAEYHVGASTEFYANITQAYRPIQFANLQAPPGTDIIDPNLKDARGYNFDIGFRGKLKDIVKFDVSIFQLQYNNRVGVITTNNGLNRLVTNVGNSASRGIESYIECNPIKVFAKDNRLDFLIFSSYAYTHARYSADHKLAATKGMQVENAPANIFRSGITAGVNGFLCTAQVSYVSESFSDANNTIMPSLNGTVGLIPSYTVSDLTFSYKFSNGLSCKSGINNLFNVTYFTRRAGGYPGPGALPADARSFFITLSAKF